MKKLTKSKVFLVLCLAFIMGVGVRSVFAWPFLVSFILALGGLSVIAVFWAQSSVRLIGLCLLIFIGGVWRYDLSMPKDDQQHIQFYNNQRINFIGLVSAEPDVRQDSTRLTVKSVRIEKNAKSVQDVRGKVLVKTTLYPEYSYGDLLEINCQLQTPQPVEDFAYDKYLARYDIYSVCYRPTIKLIARKQGNLVLTGLLYVKNRFIQSIQSVLPEPQSSFLGGLLLGAKKAIPDELMSAFNRTGTTHIVALSGYNITIIAVMVMNICQALWLAKKQSFWVSLAAITFFILITGAPSSAVRAGVMGVLVLLAKKVGRVSRMTNVLILAALVMLLMNPKILAFDAGFQLSFLATIGLVYVSPVLEKLFNKLPSFFSLKENLTATLSAIIMTTPLILFQFGRLAVLAPLVNMLILPVIPLAMGIGFVTGFLAIVWWPLGQICGYAAWVALSYVIFAVEYFSKISFASVEIAQVSWLWLAASYCVIGIALWKYKKAAGNIASGCAVKL